MKKDMKLITPMFYLTGLFTVVSLVVVFFTFSKPVFYTLLGLAFVNFLYTSVLVGLFRKKNFRYLEFLSYTLDTAQRGNLEQFPLPCVSLDETGQILWYNDFFKNDFLKGKNSADLHISAVLKDFQPTLALHPNGTNAAFEKERYSVFGVRKTHEKQEIITLFFKQDTELKRQASLYQKERPAVIQILVDNFDESLVLVKEREKNQILSDIENKIEEMCSDLDSVVSKVEKDRFVVVLSQRSMEKVMKSRFSILEKVKEFHYEINAPITLSIGAGCGGETVAECNAFANQALDMSMGRGGDQATVKTQEGYEFFGESLQSATSRRTKVKSRLMSNALVEMVKTADKVLIMGHKYADFDSVASALGVHRIATTVGTKAHVVIDFEKNLSKPLVERYNKEENFPFISEEKALELICPKTLLVIVDTHVKSLVESGEVLARCENIFVIDHHRKVVDFIDTAAVSYHEPSASSASEMVTEIAQYVAVKYKNLDIATANALLAGIMLDTKNFTVKTSVRTFEAAAYLKRCGADSSAVKRMFASSQDVFKVKSRLMANATIENGCAIAVYPQPDASLRLAAPSAADELLQVQDIRASFVVYPASGAVNISARSLGEVNVQVILEKLGGGGHLTMAGAQVTEGSTDQVAARLRGEINSYLQKNCRKEGLQ